ncbi:DUF1707 and DUF4190 domain-containing protein [Streptomyces odontomachi]|uniref:DUF1707 and DUF4190 domain-containing protein n=1 Tax=Streptomyces odontomachi TaxID=2944940 RepID=UPI0027E30F3E|nr:DUF1707 and DUF4190 domain-containing protein [Streptomyces sp. ODS25]
MLASQAERERAVDVLRAAFGEGRLQQREFEQRVARAYAARTIGELSVLVADVPQGPAPMPPTPVAMPPAVPQPYLPVLSRPVNGKAVASLVLGLMTMVTFGVTGLPAVITGHMALSELRSSGESGDAQAVIGLIMGWLSIAAWMVFFVFLVIAV